MKVLGPFVVCRSPESFWTLGVESYLTFVRVWIFGYVIDWHRRLD